MKKSILYFTGGQKGTDRVTLQVAGKLLQKKSLWSQYVTVMLVKNS